MGASRGADRSADVPAISARWVAQRLRIAPTTLRSWHHRYGVGPTSRSAGGHRRYGPDDVDRLVAMRMLVLAGLPVAEAARVSERHAGGMPEAAPRRQRRRGGGRALALCDAEPAVRELSGAAMALDQPTMEGVIASALRAHGVVHTWERVIVPVLQAVGDRYGRCGDCIEVEHLLTQIVSAALSAVLHRRRRWNDVPPVLLACTEDEHHTLPLLALAGALAEARCPSRLLGASVPVVALASAVRRIGPRAVFVWAQRPAFARVADLDAVPRRRPPIVVLAGGPGWLGQELPDHVERVDSLAAAVGRLCGELDRVPSLG